MREIEIAVNAFKWYRQCPPEKQYNSVNAAQNYDTAARLLTDREGFAKFLAEHIGPNPGRILEIAAGTGIISNALKEKPQKPFVTDLSLPTLEIAKDRTGSQVHIAQADFFNLPFPTNSFDTLVNVGGYRYVPPERKNEFWDEMQRITKPNAKLFVAQFYPRGNRIEGNDINASKHLINHNFSLINTREYSSHVNVGPLSIKSGKYLLFEFLSNKQSLHQPKVSMPIAATLSYASKK